jgi:hypothetical protein
LYGMNEYLMIMHEVQKARLACEARKGHQKEEELSRTGSPLSATGKCICERTRRR